MKQIIIEPIPEKLSDYDDIEARILEIWKKEIYIPLLKSIGQTSKTLKNSMDDFLEAIRSGRIWFYRGQFKGRFSSNTSKELKRLGAKWDRRQGLFKIPYSSLTPEIRNAISVSEARFNQTLQKIDKKLGDILPEEIASKMKLEDLFDKTIYKTQKKFEDSVKGISVAPQLTEQARMHLAFEYTQNLNLYIKEFTQKETLKLREEISKKVLGGSRYESMIGSIQRSYQVSQNKAKFLARQETSILMSKFKEARYRDIGSKKYIWKCVVGSPNHPVRPMHKIHNQKEFFWDSPPIVNEKGDRKNPGEDYGCRCTARPIITF